VAAQIEKSSVWGVASIVLTAATIIVGLVFGQPFLVPVVIALLIATLIGAGADRLQTLGVPGPLATIGAVVIVIIGIAAVFDVLASQTDAVIEAWPRYLQRLETLSNQALAWVGPGISGKINQALNSVDLAQLVPGLIGSAGGFLASVALVAIYIAFLLAERGRLPGKIDRMFSSSERTAKLRRIITDIAESIRRYIWIKTIMSLLTAGISYAVLKLLKVDFAETWVLIIFLLNYIPSIGSVLGVLFPALLALLQFDTTWQFLIIAIVLSSTQIVIGNVVEPHFMGRTLNLSPFVVIASLAFWSMIWGVVGAFLSVPMTTALVIACSHIPSCRWIAVLLSDEGLIGGDLDRPEKSSAVAD
jgi:predicted PurR-regulated permease PerM